MSAVRRLLAYVLPHRVALAGAAACMALLALSTGAYAFLIGPLLKFLVTGGAAGISQGLTLLPWLGAIDRARAFVLLPLVILSVALVKGLAYFGQFHLMGMLGQRVVASLRRDYVKSLLGKDPAYFSSAQTGDLLSRFSADVAHVERAVTYAIASYLRDGLSLVVLLGLAFWLEWKLSLVAFVAVPLMAIPIARLARKLKRRATQGQESLGRLSALVQEGLWGLKVIQAYRMEARELSRFDAENARYLRAQEKAARTRSLAPALIELASVAGIALVLRLAAQAVVEGAIAPERLLSFLATLALLYQPAKDLGRVGQFAITAIASAERLFQVMDSVPAVREQAAASPLAPMRAALSFEDLTFSYGAKQVLSGLTLEVKSGEVVALVGESGAGKSTLALLAMRYADPSSGAVRIDGASLEDKTLGSVRRQYGLVTQEPLLFSGTVAENLAYGREGASREDLEDAAKVADAHGFITALPEGYATRIGERGVRLSGGQKQRLALARALVAKAPILLLDEATSSLDAESEREVTRALDVALRDRTALVIAHRLSTIRSAHRIVVLKGGKVAEQGTHEELLLKRGEYARLHLLQESPR